jgi:hypothetical protein
MAGKSSITSIMQQHHPEELKIASTMLRWCHFGIVLCVCRRQRLALDIISAVPFDWIAYGIAAAVATAAAVGGHSPADAAATAAEVAEGAGAATAAAAVAGAVAAKGAGVLSAAGAAAGASQAASLSAAAAAAGGVVQAGGPQAVASFVPAVAFLKGLHLVSAQLLKCSVITLRLQLQHLMLNSSNSWQVCLQSANANCRQHSLYAPYVCQQLWMLAQCTAWLSPNTPPPLGAHTATAAQKPHRSPLAEPLLRSYVCAMQVRLYRVRWFFRYLEYDLTVSLLTVTVARNLVIVLYLTHWVACGFNLLARSGGYDPDMLIGLNPDLFASVSLPEQYVYSLYWSVTTLAGALGWQCVCE